MRLEINPKNPQQRLIDQVINILKNGGIIAYPTDTSYGIGCDMMNKKAVEKVLQFKKASKNQLVSFICPDLSEISRYAKVSNYAYKTMKRLLPGPYTFILEASPLVPKIMVTKRKTTGIRVPDNAICKALVSALGNPIINTSATIAEGVYFDEASFLEKELKHVLDLVIDGGPVPNQASSVVSLLDDTPEVFRKGSGNIDLFK